MYPSIFDEKQMIFFEIQKKAGSAVAAASVATSTGVIGGVQPANAATQMWTPVSLPFTDTLYDIDFDT